MSFSSTSGGSASVGSTAPSSLFTEDEARFMRDSFNNLHDSFDPFQAGAQRFKVPAALPPSVGGLPPFQHHHFNGSHSSLGSSSLAHGSDTTVGRSVHSSATTAASPTNQSRHHYYSAGPHSPATPTNHAVEGVTPSSTATASPPATTSGSAASSDAIALARLKNSESWERNAGKQQPATFFQPSWWSSAQPQQQAPDEHHHHPLSEQQRPPHNTQQRSASDLRSTNISPTSMDTASTHSRSSSALDALMLGMGAPGQGPPLSAPPSDAYADLLHLQDKGRSPEGASSSAEASSSRLTSAPNDPFDKMRSGSYAGRSAGRPGYRDDGASYPLTSAPGESYGDLYTMRDPSEQLRKQRAAAGSQAGGWAPPPQLAATIQQQQQQQQHRGSHQHQPIQPQASALYNQPQHQPPPGAGPGTQATASGVYGQDRAWQMEQLNNLRFEREKWAGQGGQAGAPAGTGAGAAVSNGHSQQQQSLAAAMGLSGGEDEDIVMHTQEHEYNTHGRSHTSNANLGGGGAQGPFSNLSAPNVADSNAHQRHRTAPGIPNGAQGRSQSLQQQVGASGPISASSLQGTTIPSGHLSILGLSMSTSHTFPTKAAYAPGATPESGHGGTGTGTGEYAGSPAGSTPGGGPGGFLVTASALSPHSPAAGSYTQQGGHSPGAAAAGARPSSSAGMGTKRARNSSIKYGGVDSGYYTNAHISSNAAESPTNARTPGSHHSGHSGAPPPPEDSSSNRPILSLSKSRNRSTSIAAGTPPTPSSFAPPGVSAATASAAAAAAAIASSQGSRLASTFATRRAPLVRPPRQNIRVNVDLARGKIPEPIGWAFFTAETADRAQAHADGIVDLRKGPVIEDGDAKAAGGEGASSSSAAAAAAAADAASGAAGKKLKAGHVLLTEAEKKANHIASEQKRRANIRKGYELLCDIVPPLKEALEREASGKDGGMGGGDEDDDDEGGDDGGATSGRGKKKRKTKGKKRDPDAAGCEIGGERIDGRAGPRSEAIVLMKSIEYLRDLLEIRRDLLLRRDHARYQAAQMCGVNIATYFGPPVSNEAARGGSGGGAGAGPSYYSNGVDDGKGEDAMQH
ncbi:unnamed protein product [Tilletia controversa]|nr:unnamed protein product [Tilletia controversa]